MKIRSVVEIGVIASLVLIAGVAIGQQNDPGMQQSGQGSNQGTNQQAMTKDPQTIMQVQQALSSQGYDPGPIDGKWTQNTENTLMRYQQAKGMQPSGQLDQQTLASLGISGGAAAGGQQDMSSSGQSGQQSPTPQQQSGSTKPGKQRSDQY